MALGGTDVMRTDAAVLYLGVNPGTYRNNRSWFGKAAIGYQRAGAILGGDAQDADAMLLTKTWSLFTSTVIQAEESVLLPVAIEGPAEDGASVGLLWEEFKRLVTKFSTS